jgi:putative serine protease PepD
VNQLRRGETPTHAKLGVEVADATSKMGLPDGALIKTVEPHTAAATAGLQRGDVITCLDHHVITDANSLVATVRSYRPGDTVTLTVEHSSSGASSARTLKVTLGSDAG